MKKCRRSVLMVVCHQVDVEKPEEVRLIDLDETHSGEHTVFIMPPEEPQEPDGSECPALYRYGSETAPHVPVSLLKIT